VAGRIYYATDTEGLSLDDGSEWVELCGLRAGAKPEAATERSGDANYEPSASRPTLVTVTVKCKSTGVASFAGSLAVGGVEVSPIEMAVPASGYTLTQQLSFICPPGAAWRVNETTVTNAAITIYSSYLPL
jgi:hypothetical protein